MDVETIPADAPIRVEAPQELLAEGESGDSVVCVKEEGLGEVVDDVLAHVATMNVEPIPADAPVRVEWLEDDDDIVVEYEDAGVLRELLEPPPPPSTAPLWHQPESPP